MNRAIHVVGAVAGVGMVAIPAVTSALPPGKVQAGVQILGALLALFSSVARALGKPVA